MIEQAVVDALMRNLTQAKEFTLAQAPDIMQQIILSARIESSFYLLIFQILIILGVFIIVKYENGNGLWAIIIGAIFSLVTIHDFILCWFAPKAYLLEHLAKLVK